MSAAIAPSTADRPRGAPPGAADLTRSLTRQSLLVAGVCLFADVLGFLSSAPVAALRPQDWAVLGAIAAADAALALPARFSGWVAGVHAVVQIVAALAADGNADTHQIAGFLIAGYRAGAWLSGASAWAALAMLMLSIVATSTIDGISRDDLIIVDVASSALLPWLVGRYTTARRGYIAELEQQAETQRRDARAAVERAVREERSSIARDLHDVISHHVSTVGVHAGAARMRLTDTTHLPEVRESLSAVETSSRAAMLDLRRLLDLLHGDPAEADRLGLDNIEDLLNGVRRAGLPTRLTSHGAERPVPDSVQTALYRSTQEMLTNAQRHGDGTIVDVHLHYGDSSVSVSTRNGTASNAAADTPETTSRGLAGIRKRAALFGGTVTYGPDTDGDHWETTVTIPLPDSL